MNTFNKEVAPIYRYSHEEAVKKIFELQSEVKIYKDLSDRQDEAITKQKDVIHRRNLQIGELKKQRVDRIKDLEEVCHNQSKEIHKLKDQLIKSFNQ
jgi:hypothetical protein